MLYSTFIRTSFSDVSYIVASLFFIFSLAGLSKQETAKRGNVFGMIGMFIAITITLFDPNFGNGALFLSALIPGILIGTVLALRVEMTQMPQCK
jgi:NAD(P) transhydrogenase subunit beta